MRIVAFSDAHFDINSAATAEISESYFTETLLEVLNSATPDILICAGDVTPDTDHLIKILKMITEEVEAQHYLFVPGNHDIWFKSPADPSNRASSSKDKYLRVFPQICYQTGFHYLPSRPIILGQIGFLGSCGWYDYSFKNPRWDDQIPMINYAAKTYRHITWNDVNYAEWEMTDPRVCEWMLQDLENDYQQLQRENVQESILVLHHVPFRQFVVYKNKISWDFCSAFIGSQKFGEWALSRQISTVIFGHTHFPQHGKVKTISAYCNPIGYLFEANKYGSNLKAFLQDRLIIINQ